MKTGKMTVILFSASEWCWCVLQYSKYMKFLSYLNLRHAGNTTFQIGTQNKGYYLTFILHIIISQMIKCKPAYEQMSDKKTTRQNLILSILKVFCLNTKNVQNTVHNTGCRVYEMLNSLFKLNHVSKECSRTMWDFDDDANFITLKSNYTDHA